MTLLRPLAFLLSCLLVAAVPAHVQTADYWGGYSGTKTVPAPQAARALNWVETDAVGAAQITPYGVKTIMYGNPNRIIAHRAMWTDADDAFAHTCGGQRARGGASYSEQYLTNPRSQTVLHLWKNNVERHSIGGHFDAIFNDDAVGALYALDQPCNYDFDNWIRAENDLQRALGWPVIYNGLNDYYNGGVAREIVLNASAIGGMMEECYATLREDHRVNGWRWIATENTEIRMAEANKYFFCYGRDLTPADQAYDSRLYTYASFLLTYDPRTSVLWQYYKTPSGGHVMPESQVVALDPVRRTARTIDDLKTSSGVYVRAYKRCFLAGRPVGPCAAAVNSDAAASHSLSLSSYRRSLALHGSGVFDGGSVSIDDRPAPPTLSPLQAVVVFR